MFILIQFSCCNSICCNHVYHIGIYVPFVCEHLYLVVVMLYLLAMHILCLYSSGKEEWPWPNARG